MPVMIGMLMSLNTRVEGLRGGFLQAFRAIFGFDNFIARARKSHLDQLTNGQGIVDR
jgi:hypothetical protein